MLRTQPFPVAQAKENASTLSSDQKRALVRRVADSQAFLRAPAMRAFLLYITDHAILGRTGKLKEQMIGVEVLGRKPNYDPADDNIVRVRAHELRGRLERYFASEGKDEPIIITVPRGAYAPEFVPRQTVFAAGAPPAPQTAEMQTRVTGRAQPGARYWLLLAVAVLVSILSTVAVTRYAVKAERPVGVNRTNEAIRDFWGQFFDKPDEELKVVYSDPSFALWQDLNGENLDLGDYLNRTYLNVQGNKLFNVAMRRVMSPADLNITVHLTTLAGDFGGKVTPQFARDTDASFFHHGDVVLIGSRRSNPWVEIYESSLNFQLGRDPHSGAPLFRNRSPKPHEAQVYAIPAMFDIQRTEEKSYASYGVVALLKGCGDHGLTVIAEGLNLQGTQAAGDMLTDPQRLTTLLRSIGHRPGTTVAPFEALFQITSLPGGYDNPKVIAYRMRMPESCGAD